MVTEMDARNIETGVYAAPLVLDGYISEQEYARQRGVSLRTCQRDRALRKCPPYCVLGKQVFYRITSVRTWLLEQERSFAPAPARGSSRGRR
jgi:hypothetical protein